MRDTDDLRRRLDTLTRAANRLRAHCRDLHDLGWEPHIGETLEGDTPGYESRPPRAGDPRARRLYERICAEVASSEAELVGLDRQMTALFTARAERPEPTRGSTISLAEHDRLRAAQRRRDDTPARLEPQPPHPGRRR